ncbi:xanthine dehydrogenase family protein molybdopterin-binding subunit [Nonomuraea sp. K274]|uniref:Xanthine dehydrogenase family protein molybdopterin-binding subunit n=1 Tax=Nonomuraea cypriaca TaxID=1187855 RepID=A0A931A937_9ACTN|nr:xanthine dehydrogenase family protein molybdopterin-binding subunit [Nonomuraea cypriaca]MBF8185699.1 xanthine dehydrogenase family protein molybdopterin-binding subunit [Nonomuraea cypriaca]
MLNRIEGRLKVTGAAKYAADNTPHDVAYGYLVTSTVGKGLVAAMDIAAARSAPGVIAVYTPDEPLTMLPPQSLVIQIGGEARRPLQDHDVNYYGQVVALVVAETFEQARDAATLVGVTYDARQPMASWEQACRDSQPSPAAPKVEILADGVPTIDEALAGSEVTVSATYDQPPKQHNPMEPHAAVAMWEGDRLTIYSGTQSPSMHALELAEAFGIDKTDVHVISPHVGGGFGGKVVTWSPTFLAAAAARALGRPVKVVTTREQLYTVTGHRTEFHQEIALGASRDGRLTAIKNVGVSAMVIENPTGVAKDLYQAPNLYLEPRLGIMDTPKATIMRAPGYEAGSFALECALDELAIKLDIDPVELRTKNYLTTTYPAPDAPEPLPFSSKHLDECYRVGAERFGWARRAARPRSVVDGDWFVGMGMASGVLPNTQFATDASVRFRANGTVAVATSTADLGTGAWTVMALLGAQFLGIPAERVKPALGDSTLPVRWEGDAMLGAAGSMTTANVASAVHDAAAEAVKELIRQAVERAGSPFHGMDPAEVRYDGGDLVGGGRRLGFGEVLTAAGMDGVGVTASATLKPETTRYKFASYAAYFCEVRVNRWTGEAVLSRMTAVVDAGAIVNPKTARSQIVGGIVMSLGQALLEDAHLEPSTGRYANANFADYLVPINADIPQSTYIS